MPQHPSHRHAPSSRRLILCTLLLALLLAALVPGLARAGLLASGSVFLPILAGESEVGSPTQTPPPNETPEVTPPPGETPEVTPPPSEIEEWLIGQWTYSIIAPPVGFTSLLELRDDGTFIKVAGSVIDSQYYSSYYAKAFEGKYRVSGDTLTFYDRLSSESQADSWEELWRLAFPSIKDVPEPDEERQFRQTPGGNLVLIDADGEETEYQRDEW